MGTFDIYVRRFAPRRAGQTVEGLERMFGLTPLQARELVASVPRVVKRRVAAERLPRYERALTELGAEYELRPCEISPAPIIAVGGDGAPDAGSGSGATLNLPAPRVDPTAKPVEPQAPRSPAGEEVSAPPDRGSLPPPRAAAPASHAPSQLPVAPRTEDTQRTVEMFGASDEAPPGVTPPRPARGTLDETGTNATVRSFRTVGGGSTPAESSVHPVRESTASTVLEVQTRPDAAPGDRPGSGDAGVPASVEPAPAAATTEPEAVHDEDEDYVFARPGPSEDEAEPESEPTVHAPVTPSMAWAGLEPAGPDERAEPRSEPDEPDAEAGSGDAGAFPPPDEVPGLTPSDRTDLVADMLVTSDLPDSPFGAPPRRRRRPGAVRGPTPGAVGLKERASEGEDSPLSRAVLAATGARRTPPPAVGLRTEGYVAEPPPPPLVVRIVMRIALGGALFLALMTIRQCQPFGSDVERALARWEQADARDGLGLPALQWMRLSQHQFAVIDKDRATALVRKLKDAGAVEVYVTDIAQAGLTQIARSLLVEMPREETKRDAVLDVARGHAGATRSYVDLGQRTIKVPL